MKKIFAYEATQDASVEKLVPLNYSKKSDAD